MVLHSTDGADSPALQSTTTHAWTSVHAWSLPLYIGQVHTARESMSPDIPVAGPSACTSWPVYHAHEPGPLLLTEYARGGADAALVPGACDPRLH